MDNKIESYWINNAKNKLNNINEYINLFDQAEDYREYLCLGHIDFFNRILTMDIYNILGYPYDKECLEIGFGGGRLLCAATNVFKHCYGIDIIDKECIEKTRNIISLSNKNNFTLLHKSDKNNIKENSIDFIYSFIVFQHLSTIDELKNYLIYSKQILKKSGCGIFYFGKNKTNNNDYINHKKLKNERGCSLLLNKTYAKNLLSEYFNIIELGEVTKKPWNNKTSGQFFIKFKNN